MWRPFFLGIGITLALLGGECLVLDHVVLSNQERPLAPPGLFQTPAPTAPGKVIAPPEWAPWVFMSTGVVILLYSFTIPARVQEG
jgi:hypothetical protein